MAPGEARRRITRLTPREVPGCGVDEQRERSRKRAHPRATTRTFPDDTGSVSIHTSATGHIDSRTTTEKRYQRHHISRRAGPAHPTRAAAICPPSPSLLLAPIAANVPGSSVITTVREVSTGTRRSRRARRDRRSPAARWSPAPAAVTARALPVAPAPAASTRRRGHRAPSRPVRLETMACAMVETIVVLGNPNAPGPWRVGDHGSVGVEEVRDDALEVVRGRDAVRVEDGDEVGGGLLRPASRRQP